MWTLAAEEVVLLATEDSHLGTTDFHLLLGILSLTFPSRVVVLMLLISSPSLSLPDSIRWFSVVIDIQDINSPGYSCKDSHRAGWKEPTPNYAIKEFDSTGKSSLYSSPASQVPVRCLVPAASVSRSVGPPEEQATEACTYTSPSWGLRSTPQCSSLSGEI